MMKVLAVSISLALVALSGCGAHQPVKAGRSSVLFYGDSIFGNWSLDSYFPGQNYINGGYFGQRSDQLLAALPDALSGANLCSGFNGPTISGVPPFFCRAIPPPRTVVIYAGWNDLFEARDPGQAVINIGEMAAMCLRAGARPVIVTLYHFDPAHPPSWDPTFIPEPFGVFVTQINSGIRQMGASLGVPVVDLEELFSGQSGYTEDGIHPLPSGYVEMHDAFAPVIN